MFLIDKETDELVAKVFDGIQANDNENEVWHVFQRDNQLKKLIQQADGTCSVAIAFIAF